MGGVIGEGAAAPCPPARGFREGALKLSTGLRGGRLTLIVGANVTVDLTSVLLHLQENWVSLVLHSEQCTRE